MTIGTDLLARETLSRLRSQYPDSAFLALGQTVFWDEPMKAVLRRLLDVNDLGGSMVVGVHDTDYFAKSRLQNRSAGRFVLMPHNAGTTRDLWSAAGEVSTLFGSETFPARNDFARLGVAFRRVAESADGGAQAFLDCMTEAWGWRGLVYTGSHDLIVHHLSLTDVGDGIIDLIKWGLANAVVQVVPGCCQNEARNVANIIEGWTRDYCRDYPERSLSDLFQDLLPRFYQLLLGYNSADVTTTCTTDLLRFASGTAGLPRFKFVDVFLNPATAEVARNAYNEVVSGSEIYTLDKFGAGSIPFDLIVPGKGRGTLRVTPRVVFVETPQPIAIGLKKAVESVHELAAVLEHRLGSNISLVGKAVSLVSMLAQEFIFVFNEEGSMYVRRTRRMNDALIAHGVALDMRPLLRLKYSTWDSLSVGKSTLRLPEHLEAAFGRSVITTPEFAESWNAVVTEQRKLCDELSRLRKPLGLLNYLVIRDPLGGWEEHLRNYLAAKSELLGIREEALPLEAEVKELYREARILAQDCARIQLDQSAHFHSVKVWNDDENEKRAAFTAKLKSLGVQKRTLLSRATKVKDQRLHLERCERAEAARRKLAEVEIAADLTRLRMIRNALLTSEGLPHINHRPSAWWLPMIDRSGEWFQRIVETAEVYTEPLVS